MTETIHPTPEMRQRFIDFCRSQGDKTYSYHDIRHCALAQFGQSLYPSHRVTGGDTFFYVKETPDPDQEATLCVYVLSGQDEGNIVCKAGTFAKIAEEMEKLK